MLSDTQLSSIETAITELLARGDDLVPGLRRQFPQMMFVCCDAKEMLEQPYRSHEQYLLYLLDRSAHCVRVTEQLKQADGIVIAIT